MIDYSSWKRKKIQISSLKLDSKNPRLSGFGDKEPNQMQIMEYMIEHENIQSLAKNIANVGFLPNNEPIVCKENDKYVVLEGNRRTTACKILNNPDLVRKTTKYRTYKSLASIVNNDLIRQLTVIVAPSREAADILIVNIHTQGSPVEKWDKTKQDRFFFNRYIDGETIDAMSHKFNLPKSAIKDSIARHNVFLEFLDLDLQEDIKKEVEDETKFNITTAERFYKSKRGREFLGIRVTNDGKIEHQLPKTEYRKRLTRIATDLLSNTLNSRTYGDESKQEAYIKELEKDTTFDLRVIHSKAYQAEFEEIPVMGNEDAPPDTDEEKENQGGTKQTQLSTTTNANKLIPAIAQGWKSGAPRIDAIFKELRECNLSTHFNAAAILFRSYLDMVVYQFLQQKGVIQELMKKEQQKIDDENNKKLQRIAKFLASKGCESEKYPTNELKKALSLKTGVSQYWVPTLKQMLDYIAQDEGILDDLKLRQALSAYLAKGNEDFLGHHDLNLLVHNEYYIKNKAELKKTWDKLYPILAFIQKN